MDRVAEIFNRAFAFSKHHGRRIVGRQSARLGVYSHEIKRLPHSVNELVNIEPVLG
jgi:hypothetical protein